MRQQGNITTINDAVQPTLFYNNSQVNPAQSFTYDTLYRLVKATGRELINSPSSGPEDNFDNGGYTATSLGSDAVQNYTQYYAYDAVGNILQLSHVAASGGYTRDYTYHNNHLLRTQIGSQEYVYSSFDTVTNTYPGYDRRGNMLLMPHLSTLSWNAVSELSKIEQGSLSAYYQYGGGQRIRKCVVKGNIQEERIYLGSYEIYRKFEGSSLKVARETVHVSDDTGRIAMLENRTYGSDDSAEKLVRYVYSNHLQSASLELDEHAAVISYEEYHPYGTTAFKYQDDGVKATAKWYRYTGKERDEESGLYYHGARYYVPWLARWCAVDPSECKNAGKSSYQYCDSNPVVYVDSDGKDKITFHYLSSTQHFSHQQAGGLIASDETQVNGSEPPSAFVSSYKWVTVEKDDNPNTYHVEKTKIDSYHNGKAPTTDSSSTEFFPNVNFSKSGITTSSHFFGIFKTKDQDKLSLIKLINEFPELGTKYLEEGANDGFQSQREKNTSEVLRAINFSDEYFRNKEIDDKATNLMLNVGMLVLGEIIVARLASGGLWLSSSLTIGEDAATLKSSKNLIPIEGVYDVVIHGSDTAPGVLFANNLNAEGLYELMLQSGYTPGTPIRLISCESGLGGASSAAQELSDLAGAKVLAPAARTKVIRGGEIVTEDNSAYIPFSPRP